MAISGNAALMPRAFAGGLNLWSRGNGTAGTQTWAGAPNAAIVPADEDFGTCLEILKQAEPTSLRYMRRTPLSPGTYLRISTRVKAVAGNLARVRIAGYAMTSTGMRVILDDATLANAGPRLLSDPGLDVALNTVEALDARVLERDA
ncbi:hypothetical protein ACFFUC_09010, partial [Paracoccus cavernae]